MFVLSFRTISLLGSSMCVFKEWHYAYAICTQIGGSLVRDSLKTLHCVLGQSKKEDKEQESIQSSTTPNPGHHMGK